MQQHKNGYSDKEILNMQQEAINRVNEMQKKARKNISNTKNHDEKYLNLKNDIHNKDKPENCANNLKDGSKGIIEKILNLLNIPSLDKLLDKDNLLIIALILILISEKYEDKIVILALVYILLDIKN